MTKNLGLWTKTQSPRLRSAPQLTKAIAEGANVDEHRGNALSYAIRQGSAAQVQALLDSGASLEWDDGPNPVAPELPFNRKQAYAECALQSSESAGKLRHLAEAGVDITDLFRGNCPYNILPLKDVRSPEDATATAHLLMDAGAPVNRSTSMAGNTPLHAMVAAGADESVIRRAVGLGADINAENAQGRTPLFNSQTASQARELILQGADPAIQDNDGRTADKHVWDKDIAQVIRYGLTRHSLAATAAKARPTPDNDLATPEQAMAARRARYGRAM